MTKKNLINRSYAVFLMVFIIFQPILDLFTSYSIYFLDLSVTPGVIIRLFIMALSALYILKAAKYQEYRKYLIYLIILGLFFIVNLIVNFYLKPTFSLFNELSYMAKMFYFNEMLVVYVLAFNDLKITDKISDLYKFPNNVVVAALIINVTMLIASVTGTGISSYDALDKVGHSGWFFSANELSTLLAIIFPIILWYASKQVKSLVKVLSWTLVLAMMYSLLIIGTKAGYLAIVASFAALLFALAAEKLFKNSSISFNNFYIALSLLIVMFASTPILPVFNNTNVQYDITSNEINEERNEQEDFIDEDLDGIEDEQVDDTEEEQSPSVDDIVYSGRSGFVELHQHYYDEAPLIQKIVGMGYAGNYEENPVIIERDFHDVFFHFGWVGSVLIFLPLMYFGVRLLGIYLRKIQFMLQVKYVMLASSIVLGLGIAFIAGHTFVAPAVSTYLTLILGYLATDLDVV